MNKMTEEVNMLREEEGNYMLDVYVAPQGSNEYKLATFQRRVYWVTNHVVVLKP